MLNGEVVRASCFYVRSTYFRAEPATGEDPGGVMAEESVTR